MLPPGFAKYRAKAAPSSLGMGKSEKVSCPSITTATHYPPLGYHSPQAADMDGILDPHLSSPSVAASASSSSCEWYWRYWSIVLLEWHWRERRRRRARPPPTNKQCQCKSWEALDRKSILSRYLFALFFPDSICRLHRQQK